MMIKNLSLKTLSTDNKNLHICLQKIAEIKLLVVFVKNF